MKNHEWCKAVTAVPMNPMQRVCTEGIDDGDQQNPE